MKRFSGRRVRHLMSDDKLGRMVMTNLGNSMGASFFDKSGAEQFLREEEIPEGFEESPEYREALAAYKARIGKL
jgi:hypothetical protein